jgi:hypothetical protein
MAAPKITPSLWQNTAPGHTMYGECEEGGYCTAGTPTPGTGVSYTIQTSFSDTVPFLYFYNPGTNGYWMYFDFIRIITTVAGASTTSMQLALKRDTVARALGTNNTTAATVNQQNGIVGPVSPLPTVLYQSSATASAIAASSSASAFVGRCGMGGLSIVGDDYLVAFGQTYSGTPGGTAVEGAGQPGSHIFSLPPVILAPFQSLTAHLWLVGNAATALSYELLTGFWLR